MTGNHLIPVARKILLTTATGLLFYLQGCADSTAAAREEAAQAQAAFEAGQITSARATIKKAVAKRDDLIELHLLAGRIELAAGSPSGSFAAYAQALELDPRNPEALAAVSRLGIQTGNLRASREAADRILVFSPADPDALLIRGLHHLIARRFNEALADADRLLRSNSANEAGAILKARALYLSGRPDEALSLMIGHEAAMGTANEATSLTLLELYRARSDVAGMLKHFAILRRLNRNDHALLLDEANLRYKIGNASEARRLVEEVIVGKDPKPDILDTALDLWWEYDPTPVGTSTLSAIAAKGSRGTKLAVARYLLERGDPRASTLISDDKSDDARALLARAKIASGDVASGRQITIAILKRDKTHCEAQLARAEGDLRGGNPRMASVAAQRAASSCPRLIQAHVTLARAMMSERNPAGLRRVFGDAIDANPQNGRLTRAFVMWLESRGETNRAVGIARRLTQKAPALVSAWVLFRDICARHPTADCTSDADRGLVAARNRFAIDLRPGEQLPKGLFGRLAEI